jgi:hypothetical protein
LRAAGLYIFMGRNLRVCPHAGADGRARRHRLFGGPRNCYGAAGGSRSRLPQPLPGSEQNNGRTLSLSLATPSPPPSARLPIAFRICGPLASECTVNRCSSPTATADTRLIHWRATTSKKTKRAGHDSVGRRRRAMAPVPLLVEMTRAECIENDASLIQIYSIADSCEAAESKELPPNSPSSSRSIIATVAVVALGVRIRHRPRPPDRTMRAGGHWRRNTKQRLPVAAHSGRNTN